METTLAVFGDVDYIRAKHVFFTMNPKSLIQRNASEITNLHNRVHETARHRDDGPAQHARWKTACSDFHANYASLAFPGGISKARDRLRAGDPTAIEYALTFIELRPYFFRSGFMYKDFVRVLKNCDLSDQQRTRYNRVRDAYLIYRRNRRRSPDYGSR